MARSGNKNTILYNLYILVYYHYNMLYIKGGNMRMGNRLKRLRFDHDDMSQEALANEVGVTRQTIHSIERAKFVPSTLLALKIARFFGRPVEDIFFIEDAGKE
jgi:putative transcriptional regulator